MCLGVAGLAPVVADPVVLGTLTVPGCGDAPQQIAVRGGVAVPELCELESAQ